MGNATLPGNINILEWHDFEDSWHFLTVSPKYDKLWETTVSIDGTRIRCAYQILSTGTDSLPNSIIPGKFQIKESRIEKELLYSSCFFLQQIMDAKQKIAVTPLDNLNTKKRYGYIIQKAAVKEKSVFLVSTADELYP